LTAVTITTKTTATTIITIEVVGGNQRETIDIKSTNTKNINKKVNSNLLFLFLLCSNAKKAV